jgi:uncharacterized repeat protein (TIGR03803 family)
MSLRKGCFQQIGATIAAIVLLSLAVHAETWTVIHNFTGPDGALPYAGLTMDSAGNLYGTTYDGGTYGGGTVFKMTHKSTGWIFTPLYSFGGADGANPGARVTIGRDGTLYGTTAFGGSTNHGTVFRLQPPTGPCRSFQCPWTETVLYSFQGGSGGGLPIFGDLAFDQQGNIYGTTNAGGYDGSKCYGLGCGTVFKLTHSGGSWSYSQVYAFQGAGDGCFPYTGVILDASGNLYGTAAACGPNNTGVVFKVTLNGSSWTQTLVHDFPNYLDGATPFGALIFDRFGDLYGTTSTSGELGGGTVYELTPASGGWNFAVVAALNAYEGPQAGPTMDASGNLYGTVGFGGFELFKLTPSGGSWIQTQFQGGSSGSKAIVIVDSNNVVYGTDSGGTQDLGSVWVVTQ